MLVEWPHQRVMIESKLSAGLRDHQADSYLQELRALSKLDHEAPVLFFLVPDSRTRSVAQEVWERLGYAGRDDVEGQHEGVIVRVGTWQTAAASIRTVGIDDPVAAYLRDAFVQMVEDMTIRSPAPMTLQEAAMLESPEFIRASQALADLLVRVREQLRTRGEQPSMSKGQDLSWSGFYSGRPEEPECRIWLGYFYQAAAHFNRGPVWLQLGSPLLEEAVRGRIQKAGFEVYEGNIFPNWGGWIIPIRLPQTDDAARQVEEIIEQIEQVRQAATSNG